MKNKVLLILLTFFSLTFSSLAGNYEVRVGSSITIYCTAEAPAGYITHVLYNLVNQSDAEYVGINYSTTDQYATVYGLKAKSSVPIEVTYAYSYLGAYDNKIHVGHGTYYDYVTVVGGRAPTAISINPSSATIGVGEEFVLTAQLTPSNATTDFAWGLITSLSDPHFNLTYLGNTCRVSATREGTAYIVAETSNGLQAVSVIKAINKAPTSVSIPGKAEVYVNSSTVITPTLEPIDAATYYKWFAESDVVSVTSQGVITGLREGRTTIYCTTANGLTSNKCEVISSYALPQDVLFAQDTSHIAVGQSLQLSCSFDPSYAQSSLQWSVSNTSIAEVTQDGKIKGKKEGKVDVFAQTENGLIAHTLIKVWPRIQHVSLPTLFTLFKTDTCILSPVFMPSNAFTQNLVWKVENEEIVSLDNGKMIAKKAGKTNVNLYDEERLVAKITVYVKQLTVVNVWTKKGILYSYNLSDRPRFVYLPEKRILLKTSHTEVIYSIDDILKITLADYNEILPPAEYEIPTSIPNQYMSPTITDGHIYLSNLKPDEQVAIYTITGSLLYTIKAENNGSVPVSLADLKGGIYLLKSSCETIKFIVK